MYEVFLNGFIVFLSVFIAVLLPLILMQKRLKSSIKDVENRAYSLLNDVIYNFMDDATQKEDVQKKLYTVGLLIGNGISKGAGLQMKGGKMKIEDMIIQGVAKMFFPQLTGGQPTQQTDVNTQWGSIT